MSPGGNPVLFGLRLYELLTLVGIIIGPIAAVIITLWSENSRREREQRTQILRMILNTRRLPSDAAYTAAINLVPVEYRNNKTVMLAWRQYIDTVRYQPTSENRITHDKNVNSRQTALIFNMMKSLGIKVAETDIENESYVANGLVAREDIYIDYLVANRDIANALQRQNELTAIMIAQAASGEAR